MSSISLRWRDPTRSEVTRCNGQEFARSCLESLRIGLGDLQRRNYTQIKMSATSGVEPYPRTPNERQERSCRFNASAAPSERSS
jgi:hypothetical protein